MRILVVEDEKNLNKLIVETLGDEGYSVDGCFDGEVALDYIEGAEYDVIIMDIMMPRMDGLTCVEKMRAKGISTPVVFLTARSSIEDRVKGLESGADYYLVKPFGFDELMAVIRAMTRKYSDNKTNVLTVADLTLNIATKQAIRGDREISLSVKEFSLLEYMIRNKGVALSREMIENNLWNYDYEGGTNVIDVYVGYLRKKIDAGFDKKLINTIWGVGWMLKE